MKYRNMFLKYQQEAGNDGSDGGSGGAGDQNNQQGAALSQADIDAAVNAATAGLKAKNTELLGKLKASGEQLKQFDGIDPEAMRAMLQKFSDSEEQELIKSGRLDEAFNKRTEKLNGEHQKQLQAKDAELQQAQTRLARLNQLAVNGALAAAAGKAGAMPESMKAVEAMAKGVFVTDDDGNVVALDADGDVVYGKDGKTPLTVAEWLEGVKEEMPNLFVMPKGAGANGSGSGVGVNLHRSKMTAEQKGDFIRQHGQQAYLALPK